MSNPAPSKMYHKVMNLMLKNGKLKLESKLSFDAFYQLCTKDHKEFFIMVSYFFNQLARVSAFPLCAAFRIDSSSHSERVFV